MAVAVVRLDSSIWPTRLAANVIDLYKVSTENSALRAPRQTLSKNNQNNKITTS